MPDAADCRSIEGLLVCADTSEREDFVEVEREVVHWEIKVLYDCCNVSEEIFGR